jgi:tetratricopeptide (TPR) repeat protein
MSLEDQCVRTLAALAAGPTLLIYDNVQAEDAVSPWLPPSGMPSHVLMTTTLDIWGPDWRALEVPPLSTEESIDLIARVGGREVSNRYGAQLASLAEGLPVQIVPQSLTLAYEARRGRLDAAALTLTEEAQESFRGVYRQLEPPAQLLLHAAARFNPQRIPRDELQNCLTAAAGWSAGEFQRRLDACLDLHVVQDGAEMRMHQLFASFVLDASMPDELAALVRKVIRMQAAPMVEIAQEVAQHPNSADTSAKLMAFAPSLERWGGQDAEISIADGETVGRALYETGQFAAAQPWFERAVAEAEKGDVNGRIDHDSLGRSLYTLGVCLSSMGQFAAAQPWCERAVAEAEKGDVNGRIDHDSLGRSLHQVGFCLSSLGQFAAAQPWFGRAVAAKEKGDVHGRIDHNSLGGSLHQLGFCLMGPFAAAQPWFERAVAEAEKGDVHGRIDHASLGTSLRAGANCLRQLGRNTEANTWEARAAELGA